jgi:hypothetical protein
MISRVKQGSNLWYNYTRVFKIKDKKEVYLEKNRG